MGSSAPPALRPSPFPVSPQVMPMTALRRQVQDRVLHVTIDRPESLGAVDEAVLEGLEAAIAAVRADRRLRALVITGTGDAFCVGLDLGLLRRAFGDLAYFRAVLERFNALLFDLEALDVPVLAAVNGLTRAGGFELLLACDLVLVAEDARIGDVHTRFGVLPGGGATQRAPRKLGSQRARELILTARWLTGREAVDYGIALRAVPRDALDGAVDELLAGLVDKPRDCLGAAKHAIVAGADLPLRAGVDLEVDTLLAYLASSPAGPEGFAAWLERRPPRWD
jgi:enoyl-CoA hydratase/carnithine racemase